VTVFKWRPQVNIAFRLSSCIYKGLFPLTEECIEECINDILELEVKVRRGQPVNTAVFRHNSS
jgi:hypothetical protein